MNIQPESMQLLDELDTSTQCLSAVVSLMVSCRSFAEVDEEGLKILLLELWHRHDALLRQLLQSG